MTLLRLYHQYNHLLIRRGELVSFYSGLVLECRAVTSHLATHRRPGPELRATTLTNTLYTGRVEVEGEQVRQSVLPLLFSQISTAFPPTLWPDFVVFMLFVDFGPDFAFIIQHTTAIYP